MGGNLAAPEGVVKCDNVNPVQWSGVIMWKCGNLALFL